MQGYCPCPSPNDFLYATTNRTSHQTREPWFSLATVNRHVPLCSCVRAARPVAKRRSLHGQAACLPSTLCAYGAQSGVQGYYPCQTRAPRGLSPSSGNFTAKPHVSRAHCAQRAQCGVKGQCPLSPNGGLCYTICREPHQPGEPWHLSCHGGNFTAKPHVSRAPCAPMARSPECRGTTPATTPAGDLWGSGF